MKQPRRDRRVALGWTAVFLLLFVLSLDFWWWGGAIRFGPLHLPRWIYYFVVLQVALAGAVHLFGRKHWRDDDAPGGVEGGGGR